MKKQFPISSGISPPWRLAFSTIVAILIITSSIAQAVPTYSYSLAGTSWTETGPGTGVFACANHYNCVRSDVVLAGAFNIQAAVRTPSNWSLEEISILDTNGAPLMQGGIPVTLHPDTCSPLCEVDTKHPATNGFVWRQFSTSDLVSETGSGSFSFQIVTRFRPNGEARGAPVASWLSDNNDTRHGYTVVDSFEEGIFAPVPVPTLSTAATILLAILLLATAAYFLSRRVRAANA